LRSAAQAAAAMGLRDLHRLRNLGKLHADRDSMEGYQAAAAFFRRVVEIDPNAAADWLQLAKVLVFAEDFAACDAALASARRLWDAAGAPGDLDYVSALSRKGQRDYAGAAAALARVTEKLPGHAHAWFQRGYMEELEGRYGEAEKSFLRVLEIDPQRRAALYRLAMVLKRLDREEDFRAALKRFQALPEEGRAEHEKCDLTAVTLRPQDRRAVEPPAAELSFRDVTREVLPEGSAAAVRQAQLVDVGVGADAVPCLLLLGAERPRLLRLAEGKAEVWDAPLAPVSELLRGDPRHVVRADFHNDGAADLLVVQERKLILVRGGEGPAFSSVREGTLPELAARLFSARAFDADHDGDLDLVAVLDGAAGVEAVLLQNNGEGIFKALPPLALLGAGSSAAPAPARASLDAHDLDQANDLDLVFAVEGAEVQALLNLRDGSFQKVPLPGLGKRTIVLVEDLNNDGAPDIFAAGGEPGWALALNAERLGSPRAVRLLPATAASGRAGGVNDAALADVDNDADLDVVLACDGGVVLLRNTAGGLLREDDAVRAGGGGRVLRVSAADLTGDGVLEVLAVVEGRGLVVLASGARPTYASWHVLLQGGKDNRDAVGAVVEQYSGRLYQSRMVKEAGGLHLGLGREDRGELDGLRVRWPQGIIQAAAVDEFPAPLLASRGSCRTGLRQKEGLVSSCPFLYTRGRQGWRFVTDILGIAPLDEWLPPGVKPRLDAEEYVRIEGGLLATHDGVLQLAVTEELRETAYLDRLELIVVEHPEATEVFTDESTRQPLYGPLRLAVVERSALSSPAAVRDEGGREVRGAVLEQDGRYLHAYRPSLPQWGGWVERCGVEITTATPACALILSGRLAWYDSTVVYSLWQNGREWGPLSLERLGDGGGSETLVEDLGLLAGMDRSLVASLAHEPLPAGTRLRLSGQHRFLWDRVLLAAALEEVELDGPRGRVRVASGELEHHSVQVAAARLGFRGFSSPRGRVALHEATYDFEDAAPRDEYAPATGRATRYGDVTELLRAHDDLLVVIVCGDSVQVEFQAPPPAEPGRRRTYFLRVSGWAKEGSFHNPSGDDVEPLPLRNMSAYPPRPEEVRRDEAYTTYIEEYQTRRVRPRAP
jgi:tetratricopeptide (TPR) repeat protein